MLQAQNVAQPMHNVVGRLMPQLQNYNFAPRLSQSCIVSLNHDVLWMLYWKRCCNVEITTSNSQYLHNIDNATSYSQSQYWDIAKNVKCGLFIFTWLHFHNLTSKLWISLITIRHFWYAFQILSIIPLLYSKSSKIAFKRFRDTKIDNLQLCIQELLKNNSRFRFWEHKETIKSNCKATNTFKEGDVIKHCRKKKEWGFPTVKDLIINLPKVVNKKKLDGLDLDQIMYKLVTLNNAMLRHLNFEPSFNLWWCCARGLFQS